VSKKDIILFTGQSGIKIEKCLEKLEKMCNARSISIEKEMTKIYGGDFLDILSLPPRILDTLWEKAFEEIDRKLSELVKDKNYIFFHFHASYYHQRKREFLSPINLEKFHKWKGRIKMIIVFIDDCYDIYKRLMAEDQMFDYIWDKEVTPLEALFQSISNLVTILTWREIEIAFSRKVSQIVGVPLYLTAVKHPSFMLSRLILKPLEGLKIFYLGHPISSTRKEEYVRPPGLVSELIEFAKNLLCQHPNLVLFIPDTIDEKRIKHETGSGSRYYPELSDPWPLPFDDPDWLFSPLPSTTQNINPLNPKNFDYTSSEEVRHAISASIAMLVERIERQVNSRDHTLVEQSKNGVIAYRPYWRGNFSYGVHEEVRHNHILKERYGEKSRKVILILPKEDLGQFRIRYLFDQIQGSIENLKNKSSLESLCNEWIKNPQKICEFSESSWNQEEIRKSIENILPRKYKFAPHFLSSKETTLSPAQMLQKEELRKAGWTKILEIVKKEDLLSSYITQQDKYLLFPRNQLEQIRQELIKNL